jgi:hypothetical protein
MMRHRALSTLIVFAVLTTLAISCTTSQSHWQNVRVASVSNGEVCFEPTGACMDSGSIDAVPPDHALTVKDCVFLEVSRDDDHDVRSAKYDPEGPCHP